MNFLYKYSINIIAIVWVEKNYCEIKYFHLLSNLPAGTIASVIKSTLCIRHNEVWSSSLVEYTRLKVTIRLFQNNMPLKISQRFLKYKFFSLIFETCLLSKFDQYSHNQLRIVM